MEREFIVNYGILDNFINLGQKNPNRTDGQLTMFRNNLRNIRQDLNELKMTINESDGKVKINGQTELKFKTIPTRYMINEETKTYRQVKQAMKEAEDSGIYDQIFKEIQKQ